MTNPLRLAALTAFLAAFLPASFAQTPPPPPVESAPPLTLEDCVIRALDKNFDVGIQRLTTSSSRQDVEVARADYDPDLSASTTRSFNKAAPDTTIIQTTDPVTGDVTTTSVSSLSSKTDSEDARLSVSQKIPTGAVVTATGLLDRNKRTPRTSSGLNPAYAGDVGLIVRQPLLRGAGPGVNRAAIQRARIGVERSDFDLKATVLDVVRNVEAAFYNLVFAREQREVRRFSLEVAQKLLDENKSRRETGVATDLEVLQSEVGVATARRDLLLAEQSARNNQDDLLQLIGRFEFDQPVGPVRFADDPVPAVSFDSSYKLALDNQPDFLSTKLSLDQLKLDLKTRKNDRLPQLDLDGSVGLASREDSYRNASTEVWNGKGYDWQVGLSITMPWGFRAENARYRQAQIAFTRQQMILRQIEQDIVVQVRTAVRAVETNEENVRISSLTTELSQRQFEQEKARYEAGLSTFRFVQQAQEDFDNARVNELRAKVDLRVSLADLARLEGSSLAHYKINVAQTP